MRSTASRRQGALIVVLAALVAACGGSSTSSASSPQTLTKTVTVRTVKQPLAYFAPMYVAADQGFARQNKLDIQFVGLQAGAEDAPAVFNGTLDITDCTFDNIANLRAQGKNLVAVYQLMDHVTLDLVVANRILQGTGVSASSPLADRYRVLKGHRFGISSPGSPSDILLRIMLKAHGLNPDRDVQIVRVGSIAGLFAALKSGQIDGYILSPPSPQQAVAAGVGTILIYNTKGEDPALNKFLYVSLCASEDYIKSNPAVVRAYVKSIQEANDWMRTHLDQTYQILQKEFPDVNPSTWSTGLPALLPAVSRNGKFDQARVAETYQLYKDNGVIQTVPPTRQGVTWTNAYLPAQS
ncbi:MAG TPA: ABC transporter substrate-binding protein [Candidatus Dormibacteraeota bacterium]|nr:ABC transporter substrate-binding protein [Candidatus Dormibacteraeota bacterium]